MKRITTLSLAFLLFASPFSSNVSAAEPDISPEEVENAYDTISIEAPNLQLLSSGNKRVEFKRGGWAAWSKGVINWKYNSSKITASNASQDSGYVFPNIVRKQGIKKISTSTSKTHIYRHKTNIGVGTPTPWGDVKVIKIDYTDYLNVNNKGKSWAN